MLDHIAEVGFRVRHRPRGLAHRPDEVHVDNVSRAIALASSFLSEQQQADGSWHGFHLYPGSSTTWITAHAAFVLESVPQLESACRRAAAFLHRIGPGDGGWGFNRRVAVDCDSSAQALLVLHRFGLRIDDFLVRTLLTMQSPCGGFPTYRPNGPHGTPSNGWQSAHPEVSAMVITLLRRLGGHDEALERTIRWLRGQLVRGLLPSYWWSGEAYGLWAQATSEMLTPEVTPIVNSLLRQPLRVPHLPFVLRAASELPCGHHVLRQAVQQLLLSQNADGSWNCAPSLRVTDPGWVRATAEAPGEIVSDKRRIFPTVHALAALVKLQARFFEAGSITVGVPDGI